MEKLLKDTLKDKLLNDFHGFALDIKENLIGKPITVQSDALKYIEGAIKVDNLATMLRIAVVGGGCSGLTYSFQCNPRTEFNKENDSIIYDSPLIVIDNESKEYLPGAKIELEENMYGKRIVINNPAAIQTCGCSTSFSMKYGN